ncbi:hypothetical protein Bca101_057880 [Brassica carinata]
MTGGKGPNSYSQHSTYQRALLEVAKEKINEAISTKLDVNSASNRFNIADFGCSTGPNTFLAVQNIIVPGSFFGRVLPRDSLHVGHCSYSLHWLSEVPKGIADRNSPAWNKDIHCTGFSEEVAEAYHDQFKIDMGSFLRARGEELVSGGLLFLLGSCLPDAIKMSETMKGMLLDFMGNCLHDVAKEGLIDQEELDCLNFPIYPGHVAEFKSVIEDNGCFTTEAFERISHANEELPLDPEFLVTSHKITFGGILETRFGKEAMEKTMERIEEKCQDILPQLANAKSGMQYFIMLRKN